MDAFSEPTFRKVIGKCIEAGPTNVILSLAQIDFIDSSGVGALVQLMKLTKNAGGNLQIVTNPRVSQTLKLVQLDKFFSLQPSIEAAVEKLEGN